VDNLYSKVPYKSWHRRGERQSHRSALERERPITNAKNKKAVTNPIRIPSKQPRPYPRTREHQKEIEDKEAVPRSRGNCAADINER
jgi:hypothetical protein